MSGHLSTSPCPVTRTVVCINQAETEAVLALILSSVCKHFNMTHVIFIVAAFVCLHMACEAIFLDRTQQIMQSPGTRFSSDPQKRNPTIIIIRGRGQQQQQQQQQHGGSLQLSAPSQRKAAKPSTRNFFRDMMMADMYDLPYLPFMNSGSGGGGGGGGGGGFLFGLGGGSSSTSGGQGGSNNFFRRAMMMDALDLPMYYI